MKKLKSHFLKVNSLIFVLLLGSILLLLVFICVATFSGAWPGSDVSAQILSALAGAVVTSMITLFLLLGQTANEEKKERSAKIFEEKLRIYNEFLQKLCNVVSDMKITKSEEIELEFQVAQIAMHTTAESINTISAQVKNIIVGIKEGNNNGEMLNELFNVADTFYKELYGEEKDSQNKERGDAINNFNFILLSKENIARSETAQRQSIINLYEGEKMLNLSDRVKLLQAMIDSHGAKQWIYGRTTLVHDFYTDVDVNTNSYYSSQNQIAIDITPNNSNREYNVSIFVRTWDLEKIRKIAAEIWPDNHFKPWPKEEPCRLLYKTVSYEEIDKNRDVFVNEIDDLLRKIKIYRDKHYPLQ